MERIEELFGLICTAEKSITAALSMLEDPKNRELRDAVNETYSLRRALEETLAAKRAVERQLAK